MRLLKEKMPHKLFFLCLIALLLFSACQTDPFDIRGDWELITAVDESNQEFDRSRSTLITLTGSPGEGEISAEISFLNGTYQVRGNRITMEIVSGRGPMWFRRNYRGVITGDGAMQGRYEGASIPLGPEEGENFSGTWWALKKP